MASEVTQALVKALEAGNYNAAPSSLVQGSALQIEDCSPVMNLVTFEDSHIKLQKALKVDPCKSTLAQFDRQLSYGIFGGSAMFEGAVGQEEDSQFVRVVVPMAYYSHTRRVTVVANMVATVDGVKAEERAASDAAKKIAGDVEFDLFRGKADFSNAGAFDGNPASIPSHMPNMLGLDPQVRMSDNERSAKDQMFSEYGSDDSVVVTVGGNLSQDAIEDSSVRSAMNMGHADTLHVDPRVLSAYNKISFGKERIILAGSAQDATGSDLRKQWVSGGTVSVEASRFLSAKTGVAASRRLAPAAPTIDTITTPAVGTSFLAGDISYRITACNEAGESAPSATSVTTLVAGDSLNFRCNGTAGDVKYFNVYASLPGGGTAGMYFIGRVAADALGKANFVNLNNRKPRFCTGYLVQKDTMAIKELSPYSRLKLAVSDLSLPEAHFRFCSLAVMQPRKNVLLDNISG